MTEWKETDYGKIPSNWKFVKGTEFCSKVTDGTHDSPKQVDSGRFLVTSKHIKGRDIDFDNAYKISEEDYKKIIARSHVDQWDVIISMIGEYCGFTYIERNHLPEYAVKNVGMFKTGNENKAKWLHYYFNSKIGKAVLEAQKTGTSQPYITLGSLRNIEILMPDDERNIKKIAEVLSSLDDKIELLHRNNKTLEQLAETLFRQWFVEEAEDSWEKTELRNLINLYRGLSYKGSGLTDKSDTKAIPMINLNSVLEGGGFKVAGTKYYNGEYRENHHVYPGDVVITNTEQGHECRLIGYSTIIPNYIGQKAIFSQHIYRITPKDKKVSSQYLNCLFKNPVLRDQIIGATNGSTVNMLPAEGVLRCIVKVPTINKMETFSKLAEDIQSKIESNYLQIQQLETLRETLLPKLMSGVVRVEN